jgi:hypothetical protein
MVAFSFQNGYCQDNTPENFVKDFYIWYLDKYIKHEKQLNDDAIYKYVDLSLIKKLKIDKKRIVMDFDYFITGQDYLDEIKIEVYNAIKINDATLVVPVNLWNDIKINPEHLPTVLVFLEKENEKFRIIKVRNFEWIEIK